MDKVLKKNTVSADFPHAPFSLFYFLILLAGTDRLSLNVSAELPHYTV